jgi:hypothetical protein
MVANPESYDLMGPKGSTGQRLSSEPGMESQLQVVEGSPQVEDEVSIVPCLCGFPTP